MKHSERSELRFTLSRARGNSILRGTLAYPSCGGAHFYSEVMYVARCSTDIQLLANKLSGEIDIKSIKIYQIKPIINPVTRVTRNESGLISFDLYFKKI